MIVTLLLIYDTIFEIFFNYININLSYLEQEDQYYFFILIATNIDTNNAKINPTGKPVCFILASALFGSWCFGLAGGFGVSGASGVLGTGATNGG